ncbi:MAG TPA: hypothetical protein VFH99_00940 [Candidatus Saccharimonadales bacterium]|nr:hypothetical protein [Candidatus Saccharimonadales bacterium]
MKHFVGSTKNGKPVYVDLIRSQAAPHIATHPYLLGLVSEALAQTKANAPRLKFEHDLQRTVGYENVVKTAPSEKVIYARVLNDELYTRFTTKGTPGATSHVSVVLLQDDSEDDTSYELVDAWIGRLKPPRPGSDNETPESREYWAGHAFLLDTQVMQRHTRTETCPY